jgi:phytoene synthase
MTSPAERKELVEQAEAAIRQGSQSFRFASRLFDRVTRERAWLLYAWCRACDDYVDGQELGHGPGTSGTTPASVERLLSRSARALAGEWLGDPPFDGLGLVALECGIPRSMIEDHLAGFALDAAGWRPSTEDELLTYCYHVAGTVGCMMAIVMGIRPEDEETIDRACDLGIAFQLANIARDIAEDHAAARIYLPAEWLAEHGIELDELMAPRHRPALCALARRLQTLASCYRRSAQVGAARLPYRCAWAVLSAAGIYGAIGDAVVARESRAWDSRTIIGKGAKLRHVVSAAIAARMAAPTYAREGLWTRPS